MMNKKQKKEYTQYVGIGLIFGVAIGYGFGLIINGYLQAPIYSGIGAGIGIVFGSIIGHIKIKKKK